MAIENLNEARAEKAGDNTLWTPLDLVRAMLRDIEDGTIKPTSMVVHYYEENPDGSSNHGFYLSNLTREQHIAILELAKWRSLEDWRR